MRERGSRQHRLLVDLRLRSQTNSLAGFPANGVAGKLVLLFASPMRLHRMQ